MIRLFALLRELKNEKSNGMKFQKLDLKTTARLVYTDASFAKDN